MSGEDESQFLTVEEEVGSQERLWQNLWFWTWLGSQQEPGLLLF